VNVDGSNVRNANLGFGTIPPGCVCYSTWTTIELRRHAELLWQPIGTDTTSVIRCWVVPQLNMFRCRSGERCSDRISHTMGTIQPREIILVYAPRVIITLKTGDFNSPSASGQGPAAAAITLVGRLSACRRHEDLEPVLYSSPPTPSGPLNLPPPYKRIW